MCLFQSLFIYVSDYSLSIFVNKIKRDSNSFFAVTFGVTKNKIKMNSQCVQKLYNSNRCTEFRRDDTFLDDFVDSPMTTYLNVPNNL